MTTKDAATVLAEMLCTDHKVEETDLIESGADRLVLEQFWRAMQPHLAHLRGFKPFTELLREQDATLADETVPLNAHVLKIYGLRYEPRIFITRKGEFLLFVADYTSPQSAHSPINTRSAMKFAEFLATYERFSATSGYASVCLWLMRRLAEAWERSLQEEASDLDRRRATLAKSTAAFASIRPVLANP